MMNPLKSGRVRAVVIAGAVLAVVGATGLVFANSSSAAGSRWVTATATTGDVTQTFTTTGSVSRRNTATATFAADGTVKSLKVSVGDQVEVGQILATLDTRALKLALLQAETTVAQAELNLYNARHPASSSSSTKKIASAKTSSSKSTGSQSSGSASGLTTVTFDLTALNEAVSAVNLAVVDEAKQCDAIMAWVNEEITGSDTTIGGDSSSASGPGTASVTPSASASPSSSATESKSDEKAAPAEASASPSATATQYAAVSDPTEDALKACATARAQLNTSNAALQTLMDQVNAAANPGSGGGSSSGTGDGSSSGGSKSGGSSSGSSSSSVSKSQVASAKATLLQANQKLQTAKDDLSDAELLAPISGTIGTITLTTGGSASSGAITIVGQGSAVVTIEVPLKTRTSLSVGQAVQVTPAGATEALDGKITNISLVETSGTAGASPTYTTTIGVSDPEQRLDSGAKASVTVPVESVTGVVVVPASAVTPTGTGTATVQVLASGSETPTTTEVKTGAVGGGRVEITEGLAAGQVVVIADRTAEIPSNQTNRRTTTTSSRSSSTASARATTQATSPATSQPSSQSTK
jgi:multidrug efflux pump subunit AcrA (membrane-fusion protein)